MREYQSPTDRDTQDRLNSFVRLTGAVGDLLHSNDEDPANVRKRRKDFVSPDGKTRYVLDRKRDDVTVEVWSNTLKDKLLRMFEGTCLVPRRNHGRKTVVRIDERNRTLTASHTRPNKTRGFATIKDGELVGGGENFSPAMMAAIDQLSQTFESRLRSEIEGEAGDKRAVREGRSHYGDVMKDILDFKKPD